MARYRLLLEYAGADFEGWQTQPGARTVQGELTRAIARVTDEREPRVVGSGRTDTGVHAEGQVASVEIAGDHVPERLRASLNGVLPADLAVLELAQAPADFDARKHARGKRYRYQIWNGRPRSPLRAARFTHVRLPLDVAAMAQAARAFEGEHDFSSLRAAGSSVRTSVRTVTSCRVEGAAGGEIVLRVAGTGFLRHMVRNLAGTLIEVGSGRRPADSIGELLAARDRNRAGPTAPAHGLTLESVEYASDSSLHPWGGPGRSAAHAPDRGHSRGKTPA